MRNFALSIILILAPLCNLKGQGIPFPGGGMVHAQSVSTVNCGEPTTAGLTTQSGVMNLALATPCTTGANGPGYSVTHVYVYTGATGGKIFTAVYSDTTSGCMSGTHCPNTAVCSDTTGVTLTSANAFNEDTPSGCGTLAANTSFWVVQARDNNSSEDAYQAGANCPAPIAFTAGSDYDSVTAGTWGSLTTASQTANCYLQYMVLTPL